MSAQTNAMSEAGFEKAAAAAPTRLTRPMYWSVRRELWEHWWVWGAPLAVAALIVLGVLFSALRGRPANLVSLNLVGQKEMIAEQWGLVGVLLMATTFLVAVFYCLDALYGERRDRSILFWRSLPVSDTVAVLAKASVPLVILPLVTFVIAAVAQWIVLGIDAAAMMAHGRSVSVMGQLPLVTMQGEMLYHLVMVHALWYAPIYAWFLLVSAWARRVPILWAFLTPLVIALVEKIAFGTSYFGRWIGYRMGGGPSGTEFGTRAAHMMHSMAGATPGRFFASAGLWGGLIVAALFLAAAVQLRRYRPPS